MKNFQGVVWSVLSATLVLSGCGDDSGSDPDARPIPDGASNPDGMPMPPDAPEGAPDAGVDATIPAYTPPTPIAVPLSAGGADQLQSAVTAPGGGIFAAGFRATGVEGAATTRRVIVIKLTTAGALDTSFSGDGIVETPLVFGGGSGDIDIAHDVTNNKLVVSATVPHVGEPASDLDIGVTRIEIDGDLDADFGDGTIPGAQVHDLSTRKLPTPATGKPNPRDNVRDIAVDATGRIYLHGSARRDNPDADADADADFVVLRLDSDGQLDSGFARNGRFQLDVKGGTLQQPVSLQATPRGIKLLADGNVLAAGYAGGDGRVFIGAQPVLFKLDTNGALVRDFDQDGVFYDNILTRQTEVYGGALHGDFLVTAGYGGPAMTVNNWVSLRFNVNTGERDLTWGGAPGGAMMVNFSTEIGSNCRNAIALPNGKSVLTGSFGPPSQPQGSPPSPLRNAAFAVLDATGRLDVAYGAKPHALPFGEGDGGDDQLWGGAVSGNTAILVGWKGTTTLTPTADNNDNSYVLVLPLQ